MKRKHKHRRLFLERLEQRELLTCSSGVESTVFDDGLQLVTTCPDEIAPAPSMQIRHNGVGVGQADQLTVRHAVSRGDTANRPVFVIDSNGFYRVRHPDADRPAGEEDPFGTSLVLAPLLITSDSANLGGEESFYLQSRISSLEVITNDSSGDLRLRLTGSPHNGNSSLPGATATWDIFIPLTTPPVGETADVDATSIRIDVVANFSQNVQLSPERMKSAEAFQVAKYSSSNVPDSHTNISGPTHDADQLRVEFIDGQFSPPLDLNTVPPNTLFFPGGLPFTDILDLNQITPAPLNGDPPNIRVEVTNFGAVDHKAQGFLTLNNDTDQDSDNLSVWLSRSFVDSLIPAGSQFTWTLEVTADDNPVHSPYLNFLNDAVNRSSFSDNRVDLGSPMVPVYTDFHSAGDYLDGNLPLGNVTVNGNNPDSARGPSSFSMTLNTPGQDGFVVFPFGDNRPREDAPLGDATVLRFQAKGDRGGQQLEVKVHGTLGDDSTVISQVFTLTTEFDDYELTLPQGTLANSITQTDFVLPARLDQGLGTVKLDNIRYSTFSFDPLRTAQSFVPESANERDENVYPQAAFLYDQALTIKALLTSRDQLMQQNAIDIADGIMLTATADGSYFDQLPAGHLLDASSNPRQHPTTRRLGDNAWFGLALLDVYRFTGDVKYLDAAAAISDWAETNLRDTGALGGYRGGFADNSSPLTFRSTEHNIDLYELNRQLFLEFAAPPNPHDVDYLARARHAGDFVMAMFDATADTGQKKFFTGTMSGSDTINTVSIPIDAQLWSILTLGTSAEYGRAIKWSEPLDFALNNLAVTDGPISGFTYSTTAKASSPNTVWTEGTAYAASVFAAAHDDVRFTQAMATLDSIRTSRPNSEGLVAATRDNLTDPSFPDIAFDRRLHVAPTAWALLAEQGRNPFHPVIDFDYDGVSDTVEDAAGDRNNDALTDSRQTDVASFPNSTGTDYITLVATPGTQLEFAGSSSTLLVLPTNGGLPEAIASGGVSFASDFVGFTLSNLPDTRNAEVTLLGTPPAGANDYFRVNSQASLAFFQLSDQTGAEVLSDRIVLHFVDGARGDDDLQTNSVVSSVGVLAAVPPDLPWQNPIAPFDSNNDGVIAPIDVLVIINELQLRGPRALPVPPTQPIQNFYDTNGDNFISPIDALVVINDLELHGSHPVGSISILLAEGESAATATIPNPEKPIGTSKPSLVKNSGNRYASLAATGWWTLACSLEAADKMLDQPQLLQDETAMEECIDILAQLRGELLTHTEQS